MSSVIHSMGLSESMIESFLDSKSRSSFCPRQTRSPSTKSMTISPGVISLNLPVPVNTRFVFDLGPNPPASKVYSRRMSASADEAPDPLEPVKLSPPPFRIWCTARTLRPESLTTALMALTAAPTSEAEFSSLTGHICAIVSMTRTSNPSRSMMCLVLPRKSSHCWSEGVRVKGIRKKPWLRFSRPYLRTLPSQVAGPSSEQ